MIKAQLPGGTKHYEPNEMIPRTDMLHSFRTTFALFGFSPIETPILHLESVLTGGDTSQNIFRIDDADRETAQRALRFDLTVPLAQYVAERSGQLALPFKRYEIGIVFRRETAQRGRYNQFMQCDFDTVGFDPDSVYADAETIAVGYYALSNAHVPDFTIKINNKKILNELPNIAQFDPVYTADVIRILDKIDKIGQSGISAELLNIQNSDGQVIISESALQSIIQFLNINNLAVADRLDALERLCNEKHASIVGIDEIRSVFALLAGLAVPADSYEFDISIARGQAYYTGIVFEARLDALPAFGTIFGGGRYDGLVSKYTNQSIPGVGGSIGIDRLFGALAELGQQQTVSTVTRVMILNLVKTRTAQSLYSNLATDLRAAGIATELYLGTETELRGQIGYVNKMHIPYCIIIGDSELETKTALIKNMETREQFSVETSQCLETMLDLARTKKR